MKNIKKACHPTRALCVPKLRDLFFHRSRFALESDASESLGRSMVEMLGVLAIIGVLSAGALAGYSKAMYRHKMNQTIDRVTKIFETLIEMEEKDWGTGPSEDGAIIGSDANGQHDAVKYGIMTEQEFASEDIGFQLPFGTITFDLNYNSEAKLHGDISINFPDARMCIDFLSIGWQNILPIDFFNPDGYIYIGNTSGNNYRITKHGQDLSMDEIIAACHSTAYLFFAYHRADW